MKQRKMLILWHWDRIRQRNQENDTNELIELIPVATASEDDTGLREIIILDEGDRVPQNIIDNIVKTLKPIDKTTTKNTSYLFFLHKDSFDHRKFENLTEQLTKLGIPKDQMQCIPFGGGDHFIYYKKLTDTGLLDQLGEFMHDDCRLENDENDDWEFRSVLTEGSDLDQPEIRAEVFDQVWEYYNYRYKKVWYELQEKLLTQFVATVKIPEGEMSLAHFLERTDKDLKSELDSICGNETTNTSPIGYLSNSDNISRPYKDLVHFIQHEQFNTTNIKHYVLNLRSKIELLLKAMPESIY